MAVIQHMDIIQWQVIMKILYINYNDNDSIISDTTIYTIFENYKYNNKIFKVIMAGDNIMNSVTTDGEGSILIIIKISMI